MTSKSLRRLAALALIIAPSIAHAQSAGGITVTQPWARATPEGASVGAAYLEIRAAGGATDRLVAASSPAAARVEIHTHEMADGVMKMRKVDSLEVSGATPLVLKPRGGHIMLIDLKAPLKEGQTVPLTLTFEKAGPLVIEAKVEPVGSAGPAAQAPQQATGVHEHHKH